MIPIMHGRLEHIPVTYLQVTLALLTILDAAADQLMVNLARRHGNRGLRHALHSRHLHLADHTHTISCFDGRRGALALTRAKCTQVHIHLLDCLAVFEHLGEVNTLSHVVIAGCVAVVVHGPDRCTLEWLL